MNHRTVIWGLSRLFLCIITLAATGGCSKTPTETEPQQNPQPAPAENRDHLIGWYKMDDGTCITVFKRQGRYYSTARGLEIPLKPAPRGLTWDVSASSMTGTTIEQDPQTGAYSIRIYDAQRANFEEHFQPGKPQPLVKTTPPFEFPQSLAEPPKISDDLIGWYRVVWFPYLAIRIYRQDGVYYATEYMIRPNGELTDYHQQTLQVLTDRPGFRLKDSLLIYNKDLKRLEITLDKTSIASPLARTSQEAIPPSPEVEIGIPTWH